MKIKKYILILIAFVSIFILGSVYADEVDVSLSSDKVTFGDTITLTFSLNAKSKGVSPDFTPLTKDFDILGKSYGNYISVLNGDVKSQSVWTLTVQPKKSGDLVIPEIIFGKFKSKNSKVSVSDLPAITVDNNSSMFVKAEISNPSSYVQSQSVYTFKLFYNTEIENPRVDIPKVDGILFVELANDKQYRTSIDGNAYNVVEKSFAIFPQNPGKVNIKPFKFYGLTQDKSSNKYNSPFYLNPLKKVILTTESMKIDVKDIPTTFNGEHWLPAKDINLKEEWSENPKAMQIGTPITRTIILEAEGLRADQLPDLKFKDVAGVNIYKDPPVRNTQVKGDLVIGVLQQKITYIPNTSKTINIPEFKIEWWNLKENRAASVSLASISTAIKGSPIILDKPTNNLVPVSQALISNSNNSAVPFYQEKWFYIAVLFLSIWLFTLYYFLRNKTKKKIERITALDESSFIEACKSGNSLVAYNYLIVWGKNLTKTSHVNLKILAKYFDSEEFSSELRNLEKALYDKVKYNWNGLDLLKAYRYIKKHKILGKKNNEFDVLPPLNP